MMAASAAATVPGEIYNPANGRISPTVASETGSMVWGYATDNVVPDIYPEGFNGYILVGMPGNVSNMFAGDKITSLILGRGVFQEEEPLIDVYITKDLYGEPVYVMKDQVFIGETGEWVEFPLETPFEIEAGETYYMGFKYANIHEGNCAIVTDMVPTSDPNAEIIGFDGTFTWEDEDGTIHEEPIDLYYMQIGDQVGSACVRARIEGDKFPQYNLQVVDPVFPTFKHTDEEFEVTMTVVNKAAQTINKINGRWLVDGEESGTFELDNLDIANGTQKELHIAGISIPTEGEHIVAVELLKLDGNDDEDPSNNSASDYVLTMNPGSGFQRNVLVEEGTGTWCGNCPRGIVGMEYMNETYPDGTFVGIAEHDEDEMYTEAFDYMLYNYFYSMGFPSCVLDRVPALLIDPAKEVLEPAFLERREIPSYADITIKSAEVEGNMLHVDVAANFAFDLNDANLRWAVAIKENNVGPYRQSNYYANGAMGELEGWDDKGSKVNTYFNEVGRNIETCEGLPDSFPTQISASEPCEMNMEISLDNVTDVNETTVVAIILNGRNGTVVNSKQMKVSELVGIDEIASAATVKIMAGKGTLTVEGDFTRAEVYSVAGVRMASLSAGETVNLPAGLYIVKAGEKSQKVMVK